MRPAHREAPQLQGHQHWATTWGDIELPDYALLWQLSNKQKHEVYGLKRTPTGGKVEGEEGVGRGHSARTPQTVEPVIWG